MTYYSRNGDGRVSAPISSPAEKRKGLSASTSTRRRGRDCSAGKCTPPFEPANYGTSEPWIFIGLAFGIFIGFAVLITAMTGK